MKVLLPGFEPFGGETINPSWEMVKAAQAPAGMQLEKMLLPVSFRKAPALIEEKIKSLRPDVILSLGQAGGREGISLERSAVNLADARLADNDGVQPRDEALQAAGPAAYFSTLPLRRMEAALWEAGLPASLSNTAGLYVCNAVFYTAARLAESLNPALRAGFVHVPYLPEQAADKEAPSLSLEEDIRALEIILGCLEGSGEERD